jgi:hypothetical protein
MRINTVNREALIRNTNAQIYLNIEEQTNKKAQQT